MAKEYGVEYNGNLSFPMEFECIANQILIHNPTIGDAIYHDLKEKIIVQIENCVLPSVNPHIAFSALPINSILTTNYEYLIEKSLDASFSIDGIKRKNGDRYNLHSLNTVAGISVYHIHGEIKYVDSICLGYEHYAGALQNLRANYAVTDRDTNKLKIHSILTTPHEKTIWSDKFFIDNVHIIGLALSQSEIDLWWLLTYRAYLYHTNKDALSQYINNTIVYHHVSTLEDENMKYALEKLHVIYAFHKIPDTSAESYLRGYLEVAQQLKLSL